MNITKYGHCCLLVEIDGVRFLTDPGNYNDIPQVEGLHAILLTHEHQDHVHIPALKHVLADNPDVKIFTHEGVGKILSQEGIHYTSIVDKEEVIVGGITISSHGTKHACIHPDLPLVQNTGFWIGKRLFYPGDSFYVPEVQVEILALPVAGPWMKLEEAIEYAKDVKPKKVFPVHDGMLRQDHQLGPTRRIPKMLLEPLGIEYLDMKEGETKKF